MSLKPYNQPFAAVSAYCITCRKWTLELVVSNDDSSVAMMREKIFESHRKWINPCTGVLVEHTMTIQEAQRRGIIR